METFYVIGSALAILALLISLLGITRKDFPSSKAVERGIAAVFTVLVLAAVGSAVTGSASHESGHEGEREGGEPSPGLSR